MDTMIRISLLILTIFSGAVIGDSIYGNYCGLGHGSNLGIEPIDDLDRVCQIHDICVSALGYTNCLCSEQLYTSISQLFLTTQEQKKYRDYVLSIMYEAILLCANSNEILYVHASNLYPGQNYIPYFPYSNTPDGSKYINIVSDNDNFDYYLVEDYTKFTHDVANKKCCDFGKPVYEYVLVEIPPNSVLVALVSPHLPNNTIAASMITEIDEDASWEILGLRKFNERLTSSNKDLSSSNKNLRHSKNKLVGSLIAVCIASITIISTLTTLIIVGEMRQKKSRRAYVKYTNLENPNDEPDNLLGESD